MSNYISAVIFDLDGTLLNTEQVEKGILGDFLARYDKVPDREKDEKRLGITHDDIAVAVVRDYQLPITPQSFTLQIMPMYHEKWISAKALPGANRLLEHLHKQKVPFALASNSIGWKEMFSVIIGSDQVKSGKPSPDLFLEAAKRMGVDPKNCLVIEDSLVGVKAAKAAGMKAVALPSLTNAFNQYYSFADSVLNLLLEFQPELWGLPPFDDWVNDTLPIEPFQLKCWYNNGLLYHYGGSEESVLPDQVVGKYFGWAKFNNTDEVFKVVTSIELERSTSKRKIRIHFLDVSEERRSEQDVQILLVGYIRSLSKVENKGSEIEVNEEDKSSASASLNLPIFNDHKLFL